MIEQPRQNQRALESEMVKRGAERYQRKRQIAEGRGLETTTPAGQ